MVGTDHCGRVNDISLLLVSHKTSEMVSGFVITIMFVKVTINRVQDTSSSLVTVKTSTHYNTAASMPDMTYSVGLLV